MHIPDGYLSPATCVSLYAAAAPFWYVALQRLKRLLHTKALPLLSVFAAFSFVVMMFNLPLPGGTSAHAVGMGIAAIVLGPWGAIMAISVALTIQALFFGDGGITTLGANCFNMAIMGSLAAYGVYRMVSSGAEIKAKRRVVAAALAGYVGINVSAALTGIELGLQPMLFTDDTGTPLYAPYPLMIAVPAMMIGHLTFAGLAEMFVTGGLVAYLQKTNPALLERTAQLQIGGSPPQNGVVGWRATRPLWIGLAVLLIATPLGLLAAGSAWGEWGVEDFTNPERREQIQAASGGNALPDGAPEGLERLSSMWTAPFPDYAPPFLKRKEFGYVMAAMLGVGLIVAVFLLIGMIAPSSAAKEKVGTHDTANPDRLSAGA